MIPAFILHRSPGKLEGALRRPSGLPSTRSIQSCTTCLHYETDIRRKDERAPVTFSNKKPFTSHTAATDQYLVLRETHHELERYYINNYAGPQSSDTSKKIGRQASAMIVSLPPGIEPGSRAKSEPGAEMTSSHTDHYTTEDYMDCTQTGVDHLS